MTGTNINSLWLAEFSPVISLETGRTVVADIARRRAERLAEYRADFAPLGTGRRAKLWRHIFHRYQSPSRIPRLTVPYLETIANRCWQFAEGPIPSHLPCGADDAYGERQGRAFEWAAEYFSAAAYLRVNGGLS
jgi:hypothetical protein